MYFRKLLHRIRTITKPQSVFHYLRKIRSSKNTISKKENSIKKKSKKKLILVASSIFAILSSISVFAYLFSQGYFEQNMDRDFSRGVLALNTDKSAYQVGETVLFQMASVDSKGDTLCDSKLELEISLPGSSFFAKKKVSLKFGSEIIPQLTCDPANNVTNEPDYITRFKPTTAGKYHLKLINLDTGKIVKSSLVVANTKPSMVVERSGATRINPSKSDRYPMVIKLTVAQAFKGQVHDFIPADFQLMWQGKAKLEELPADSRNQFKKVSWDVELAAGESIELAYEYTAPTISPAFYKLGLLKLVDEAGKQLFQEESQWQIVADDVTNSGVIIYGDATEAAGSDDNLNFRTLTDVSSVGGESLTADTTDTNIITFTKVLASPTRDEKIAVHQKDGGRMDILKCTGGCDADTDWSTIATYSNITSTTNDTIIRSFDIAYEQLSGLFTVVFAVNADAGDVYYCQYDGTNWSPATVCGSTFAPGATNQIDMDASTVTGQPEWVRLVARGDRLNSYRSDELLLAVSDANDDLFLAHWTGSAWDSANNPVDNLSANNAQKFDVAWEETTGEGLAVFTDTVDAALRFSTYSAGSGWSAVDTTNGPTNPSTVAWNGWLELASDPMSDDIALVGSFTGTVDADAAIWTGSAWTDSTTALTDQETATGKNIGVAFERFTGRAVILNVGANDQDIDRHCWTSAGGFTALDASFISATMNADDIEDLWLVPSHNSNKMIGLSSDILDTLEGWTYSGATGCADSDFANTSTAQLHGAGYQGATANTSRQPSHATYTPYSPWSLNWRFYDDETVDNPTTGLNGAAENTTPTNVDKEEFIRLRMNMAERGGMSQGETRKILQYAVGSASCTPNSVENDPDCTWTAVGDTSETTAVWRYATAGETCTGCADGSTSNTPSLTSTTTGDPEVFYVSDKDAAHDADFDHAALTVKEIDFPLKAEAVTGGATYYFRLYEPRISSIGQDSVVFREQDDDGANDCAGGVCTYPSLTTTEDVITISGTIRQTNESSAYDCSAVTAVTVHSSTGGAANRSADCTTSGGTYSITTAIDPTAANVPITVYIDSAEGIKGTTVTLSSAGATNITNLDIVVDRVVVTQESATAITNAHLATADNGNAGIRYAVSGGNLTVESPMELHIRTTETFAPGGNVTTDKIHIVGAYTGSTETLTVLGSGTSTSRPLYIEGGTFTAPATTVFQGTSATDIESTTFNALSFTPTITGATTYTLLGAETINGNFTINPTAGSTQLLTVNAGGTITVGAAYTTTISGTTSGTSTLDLRPSSTDYNLSTGLINITAAGTLDATSAVSTITLTGTSGTLFTRTGVFTAGSSTVIYNGDGDVTLTSGTFQTTNAFYNLSLTPSISTAGRTYTFGAGAIDITSDFTIQPSGTQLLTVNLAGNIAVTDTLSITRSSTATSSLATGASNPTLSAGDINIATGGTLTGASSTSVITLTENGTPFVVAGTYTPGSTTISYVPVSTTGVTVASGTYYNITFNKASNTFSLTTSGITITNDLTITAGVLDTVNGSNYPITVGRHWTNSVGTAGFEARQGTVTFNTTTTAEITGQTTFYNFTAATAGKTIKFGDATTFRINGLFTLTGTTGPSYVTLDSVTGGSATWTINHQGTESISYASVKNSACDGTSTIISADDGTSYDAGNNGACWYFVAPAINASYWKIDEGYGSTINDSSGNGNSGTLAGTNLPTWRQKDQCVSEKCLYFEGTTAKVTVGTTVNTKSVSFWARPTSTTTTFLQLNGSAFISATAGTLSATGFTAPTFYVNGIPTTTIVANKWQHIVVTTGTTVTGSAVILGNNSTNFYSGYIDDVRLDSSQYSLAQIRGIYISKGGSDIVNAAFGPDNSTFSDGLVGYWKLDGDATDSSGVGNTLTNNGTTTFVGGKFGSGSEHVPASSQYFSTATGNVNTYYFDTSNAGPTDIGSVWLNDPNAFDGSTLTYADTATNGSGDSNYLSAEGTNAPSGNTSGIASVRARIHGISTLDDYVGGKVYFDGALLGTATQALEAEGWSSYVNLSTPTGGWTWSKTGLLEIRFYRIGAGGGSIYVTRGEIEVTESGANLQATRTVSFWTNPDADTNYYLSLSDSAYITSTTGTLAATGFTNAKIYVNGEETTTIVANEWQHVVVTFDSLTPTYVNIGKQGTNYFDGTMDEVRLYNKILSPGDVAKLYAFAPGPVGYWDFNENTGTTANDKSGNGNNGAFTNSGWTVGRLGSAMSAKVDAAQDVVTVTDPASGVLDFGATQDFSYGLWMKINASESLTQLINKNFADSGTQAGYTIYYSEGGGAGGLSCQMGDGTNSDNAENLGPGVNDGNWHHVMCVLDRDGSEMGVPGLFMYIDGTLGASDETLSMTGTLANTGNVTIGEDDTNSEMTGGALDEVRIYNYARSPAQVVEDMNGGHPVGGSPIGSSKGYWKLDDGAGTNAQDTSTATNNNDLTLSGASWTTDGKFGTAFNGTGANWLYRNDDADFDFGSGTDMTVSLWFRSDGASTANTEYLVSKENSTAGYAVWLNTGGEVIFGVDDDATSFPERQAGDVSWNPDYYDQTWHHFAGVLYRSSSSDYIRVYIDGRLIQSTTFTGTANSLANADTLTFGSRNTADDTDDFTGDLDEIKIFASALTEAQVKIEYSRGAGAKLGSLGTTSSGAADESAARSYCVPGDSASCTAPVAVYSLDENTGTSANNIMGGSYVGTLTSGPTWARGKFGSGVNFDGSNDYLITGNSFNPTSAYTVSMWAYLRTTSTDDTFFSSDTSSTSSLALYIGNGANNNMTYCNDSVCSGTSSSLDNVLTDNSWQHITFTYDGGGASRFYVNGLDVTSDGANSETSDTGNKIFGNYDTTNSIALDGILDDIRVYNHVRSSAQIAWDYNRGAPAAWYKMDDCTGTTINNTAPAASGGDSGFDGTLSLSPSDITSAGSCDTAGSTAWYNGAVGKINASISLDGTDDRIEITDTTNSIFDFATGQQFATSAWINPTSLPASDAYASILSKAGTNGNGYYVQVQGNGGLEFCTWTTSSGGDCFSTNTTPVVTGQWQHIAFTWTPGTGSTARFYYNGVERPGTWNGTGGTLVNDADNATVTIGSSGGTSEIYDGKIDDLRVYRYSPTASQIKTIYNEGSAVRFK